MPMFSLILVRLTMVTLTSLIVLDKSGRCSGFKTILTLICLILGLYEVYDSVYLLIGIKEGGVSIYPEVSATFFIVKFLRALILMAFPFLRGRPSVLVISCVIALSLY